MRNHSMLYFFLLAYVSLQKLQVQPQTPFHAHTTDPSSGMSVKRCLLQGVRLGISNIANYNSSMINDEALIWELLFWLEKKMCHSIDFMK